jgi:hypothetical protein
MKTRQVIAVQGKGPPKGGPFFFRPTSAAKAVKPFFVWHNTTRMHYKINLNANYNGVTRYGV